MLQNTFNKQMMTHLEVRLLRVLGAKEGLGGLIPGQLLVDAVNGVGDVFEALHEQLIALLLDSLEVVLGLLCPLPHRLKVLVGLLEFLVTHASSLSLVAHKQKRREGPSENLPRWPGTEWRRLSSLQEWAEARLGRPWSPA